MVPRPPPPPPPPLLLLGRGMSQSGAAATQQAALRWYRQPSAQLFGPFENTGRSKTGRPEGADVRSAQASGAIKVSGPLPNGKQHYFPFAYFRHT